MILAIFKLWDLPQWLVRTQGYASHELQVSFRNHWIWRQCGIYQDHISLTLPQLSMQEHSRDHDCMYLIDVHESDISNARHKIKKNIHELRMIDKHLW